MREPASAGVAELRHAFIRDEIVDLVHFKRLERRPLYALGVERRDAHGRRDAPLKEIRRALES